MYKIKESRLRNAIVTGVMVVVAGYLSYETYRLSVKEESIGPIEVKNFDMQIPPVTYGDNFFGVSFPDKDNGWVVGSYGTVIHTQDGGQNWLRQNSHTREPLIAVTFVDPQNGWAVGKAGIIVHTADGGKTWEAQDSTTKHLLSGVRFVDSKQGWAVGEWGTILHTSDGGQHWVAQETGNDVILNGLFFLDASNGWVVGEKGTVLKTSDGGATWVSKSHNIHVEITEHVRGTPLTIKDLSIFTACFLTPAEGWVAGIDGVMFHTMDGGESWDVVPKASKRSLFDMVVRDGHGWAVGTEGTYITSDDGGKMWKQPDPSPVPTTYWMYRADFVTPQLGYVVGAHGTIFRTEDAGQSWKQLGNPMGS